MSNAESWHLDKRVPLALIVALLGQAIGALWYVGRMEARFDARIAVIEQQIREQAARDERQDRFVAESVALLRSHLERMEAKLDRIYERDHHDVPGGRRR